MRSDRNAVLNDSERHRVRWRTLALDESIASSLAVQRAGPDTFAITSLDDRPTF